MARRQACLCLAMATRKKERPQERKRQGDTPREGHVWVGFMKKERAAFFRFTRSRKWKVAAGASAFLILPFID